MSNPPKSGSHRRSALSRIVALTGTHGGPLPVLEATVCRLMGCRSSVRELGRDPDGPRSFSKLESSFRSCPKYSSLM